jgi:hypothetical protein
VGFFQNLSDGRLFGGSKPNFQPHPDDAAAAAREGLPDGNLRDLLEVLCQLSRDHAVDWEFSHDYDPGPIGFIRGGVCETRLRHQVEAFADLGDVLTDVRAESDHPGDEEGDDDDEGPRILPFRPRTD